MTLKMITRLEQWKLVIETNPLDEVIRIIYGNEYEKIYVNNEKLLKLIEGIAAFKEKIRFLEKTFKINVRMSIFESIFFILIRLLFIPL